MFILLDHGVSTLLVQLKISRHLNWSARCCWNSTSVNLRCWVNANITERFEEMNRQFIINHYQPLEKNSRVTFIWRKGSVQKKTEEPGKSEWLFCNLSGSEASLEIREIHLV